MQSRFINKYIDKIHMKSAAPMGPCTMVLADYEKYYSVPLITLRTIDDSEFPRRFYGKELGKL
jgi:hypothetical protein